MPIAIQCSKCATRLRVPETTAGKRIKCPKCEAAVAVPPTPGQTNAASPGVPAAPSNSATRWPSGDAVGPRAGPASEEPPAASSEATPAGQERLWRLQIENGDQFGPVRKAELDQWVAEGRVTPSCQLREDESAEWTPAVEAYPHLAMHLAEEQALIADGAHASEPSGNDTHVTPTMEPDEYAGAVDFDGGYPSLRRARSYPAMSLARRMFPVLGWVVLVSGVLGFLVGIVWLTVALGGLLERRAPAGVMFWTVTAVVAQLLLFMFLAAVSVVSLWFASDAIRWMLDLQEDTSELRQILREWAAKRDAAEKDE